MPIDTRCLLPWTIKTLYRVNLTQSCMELPKHTCLGPWPGTRSLARGTEKDLCVLKRTLAPDWVSAGCCVDVVFVSVDSRRATQQVSNHNQWPHTERDSR